MDFGFKPPTSSGAPYPGYPGSTGIPNFGQNLSTPYRTGDITNPKSYSEYSPSSGNFMEMLMGMMQQIMAIISSIIGSGGFGGGASNEGGHGGGGDGGGGFGGFSRYADPGGNGHGGDGYTGNTGGGGNGGGPASTGGGKPLGRGNFTFQAGSGDRVSNVQDPIGNRKNVMRVDFNQGTMTRNSTSPRAELKVNHSLREGGTHSAKFGVMRSSNFNTTVFQVLDHNGRKPSPRMWISVRDGQYTLHLREGSGANAPVIRHSLGKASSGKWDDIEVDFKRGINNGGVSIKINGETVFSKGGISTMYNTHSGDAYFKVGQYRNQDDTSPGSLFISDFTVGGG